MQAQLPKLFGLFLVVCFGSCMDVAAIQQDMPSPLDFNRELVTVGGYGCPFKFESELNQNLGGSGGCSLHGS